MLLSLCVPLAAVIMVKSESETNYYNFMHPQATDLKLLLLNAKFLPVTNYYNFMHPLGTELKLSLITHLTLPTILLV